MALSTQSAFKAKRRAFNALKNLNFASSSLEQLLSAFFQEVSQKKGNPDLQVVEFDAQSTTDAVIADAACKLYAVIGKAGSSAADVRWADHASSANTPTTTLAIGASEHFVYIFPGGKAMANGLTFDESGASGSKGVFIIGAA